MPYAHLVCVGNALMEIGKILQTQVMTSINSQTNFLCMPCGNHKRLYGFLAILFVSLGIRTCVKFASLA